MGGVKDRTEDEEERDEGDDGDDAESDMSDHYPGMNESTTRLTGNSPYDQSGQYGAFTTFPFSSQTSACCRLKTFESKYPFRSPGTVLVLVCRPIFTRWLSAMCLGIKVSLRGKSERAG